MKAYETLRGYGADMRYPKRQFGGSARNVGQAYDAANRRKTRGFLRNQLTKELAALHNGNE